jgi:hypothetical protein
MKDHAHAPLSAHYPGESLNDDEMAGARREKKSWKKG